MCRLCFSVWRDFADVWCTFCEGGFENDPFREWRFVVSRAAVWTLFFGFQIVLNVLMTLSDFCSIVTRYFNHAHVLFKRKAVVFPLSKTSFIPVTLIVDNQIFTLILLNKIL